MSTDTYHIYIDKIIQITDQFFIEHTGYSYIWEKSDSRHTLYVAKEGCKNPKSNKEKGILHVFLKRNGTSFQCQGKLIKICEECKARIIEDGRINIDPSGSKQFVFRKVSTDQFNELMEWLRLNASLQHKSHPGDSQIVSRHTICGPYNSSIHITYYHTETMMIQGAISSLLITTVQEANELLKADEISSESSFLHILETLPTEIINSDLTIHFPNNLHEINATPYENMILSSIHLINSTITLPDYTCLAFGALRALEGVLGLRIHLSHPMSNPEDKIGNFFRPITPGSFQFKSSYNFFDSKPALKRACESGYTYYNQHRHPNFHVDIPNPQNTFIIETKEKAIDTVKDTLTRIAAILSHWND